MRSIREAVLGLALVALVPAGCASAAPQEGSKPERVCIRKAEINVVRALDDEHVGVKLGASRFYLLTVTKPCDGLSEARAIAFEGTATRVCSDGSSLVSFEYPTVGPMRCRVERIEPVADMNAARELIEARAKEK
jgi:Family of unknown function (DUF6491)